MGSKICRQCGATVKTSGGLCMQCSERATERERIRLEVSNPGCPQCDGKGYSGFNWALSALGQGRDIDRYQRHLKRIETLRFGSLYACCVCEQWWYLDANEESMCFVPQKQRALLQAWNGTPLELEEKPFQAAVQIGATISSPLGSQIPTLNIPCRAIIRNGTAVEPALIALQNYPPIDSALRVGRLLNEVAEIHPSRFALPIEVRRAAAAASEVRMGFAPTKVKSSDGTVFTLNGSVNFVMLDQLNGSDLKLTYWARESESEAIGEDVKSIVRFIGDWPARADAFTAKR